jgi:hypothetical protein
MTSFNSCQFDLEIVLLEDLLGLFDIGSPIDLVVRISWKNLQVVEMYFQVAWRIHV